MSDHILTQSAEGGVGRIHFNSPRTLNALSLPMAIAFREAAVRLVTQPEIRVIVLTAEGRAFMAGGDLRLFHQAEDKPAAARALITEVNLGLQALNASDKIIVSAVQGAVAGGGIGIALSADIVIAADDAVFTTAYSRIGATLDCGGSYALARRAGYGKALELALLSDPLPAVKALALGIVNRAVPREVLQSETDTLVNRLIEGSPTAQRNVKSLLLNASTNTYSEQLQAELETFVSCAQGSDFAEGVAAFLEKRQPAFKRQ